MLVNLLVVTESYSVGVTLTSTGNRQGVVVIKRSVLICQAGQRVNVDMYSWFERPFVEGGWNVVSETIGGRLQS